jgi:hypothetical protein
MAIHIAVKIVALKAVSKAITGAAFKLIEIAAELIDIVDPPITAMAVEAIKAEITETIKLVPFNTTDWAAKLAIEMPAFIAIKAIGINRKAPTVVETKAPAAIIAVLADTMPEIMRFEEARTIAKSVMLAKTSFKQARLAKIKPTAVSRTNSSIAIKSEVAMD